MLNTSNIKLLNDPGWGKDPGQKNKPNGQEGPPDLDEVLGQWMNAAKKYMGGQDFKKGGAQPPNNKSPLRPKMNFSGFKPVYALAIFLLGLMIWGASGFFMVREGQVGVITQFGSYTRTVLPGFQWHIPYPIQDVEIVNVEAVRSFSVGYRESARNKVLPEALMLTEDENIVDLQFDVQYRLKGDLQESNGYSAAANYLFRGVNPDESVRQAAETAMREIVGKQEMNKILYESRTKAAQDVRSLMQTILDRYQSGIEVITVAIQNVQPPEQVQAAFEDAIKAGQDNERQKNEGNAYASKVIPEAQGQAFRMIQDAQGYKARVVGLAEGKTARFDSILSEYVRAPQIMRDRLYLESMSEVYSKVSKVLVNSHDVKPVIFLPQPGQSHLTDVQSAAVIVGQDQEVSMPYHMQKPTTTQSSQEPDRSLRSNR